MGRGGGLAAVGVGGRNQHFGGGGGTGGDEEGFNSVGK